MSFETNTPQQPVAAAQSNHKGYLVLILVLCLGLVLALALYYAIEKSNKRTPQAVTTETSETTTVPTGEFDEAKVDSFFEEVNREVPPPTIEGQEVFTGEVEVKTDEDLFEEARMGTSSDSASTGDPELLFEQLLIEVPEDETVNIE